MFWLRVYPLSPDVTVHDIRSLFQPCGNIAHAMFRSARCLGRRYRGMKYAVLYVPEGIDAIRMRNAFYNTTYE